MITLPKVLRITPKQKNGPCQMPNDGEICLGCPLGGQLRFFSSQCTGNLQKHKKLTVLLSGKDARC